MEKMRMLSSIVLLLACILAGCVSLLPKEKRVTKTQWSNFDTAKAAFEAVTPRSTSVTQLKKLGFDVYSSPNVRIMNYLDIAAATLPLKNGNISEGFLACFKAQSKCQAFEFEPQTIDSRRYGNFWLDIFNFRRKSRETGWRFKALFVVVDNVVVEKLWSGNPLIYVDMDRVNPLGPLQDLGNSVPLRFYW